LKLITAFGEILISAFSFPYFSFCFGMEPRESAAGDGRSAERGEQSAKRVIAKRRGQSAKRQAPSAQPLALCAPRFAPCALLGVLFASPSK